jgi:hypothetical protein
MMGPLIKGILISLMIILFIFPICVAAEKIPLYAKTPKINSVAAAYKAKIQFIVVPAKAGIQSFQ